MKTKNKMKQTKKIVWEFTNKRKLTASDFVRYFERKVLRTIRKYQMPIGMIHGKGVKNSVINNIMKDLQKRKGGISDESLTDISNKTIYMMMHETGKISAGKKLKKLLPKNQPLYFLSDEEIMLYAKLKGIKGKIEKRNRKNKEVDDFLKILEQKNQDIRQNIAQALMGVEK